MARFKNISGEDLRVGRADGPLIKAGQVTTVDGDAAAGLDDAWIVGAGDGARAWPKAIWELLDKPTSNTENDKDGE